MDSVLQLCESSNSDYPGYFEVFLNNCLKQFPNNFSANDYLFSAAYFLSLECGFFPSSPGELSHSVDSFDIRRLRSIRSYNTEHMKLEKNEEGDYWVYRIQLELGSYRCKCELQGVPSGEDNGYLIVNFFSKKFSTVRSVCLDTENFTKRNEKSSNHKIYLSNLQELSLLLKDKVYNPIKGEIMLCEGQGCYPHLLRLPEHIQMKIIYYIIGKQIDIQNLALSCKYFYRMIRNDTKIWEFLCIRERDRPHFHESLNFMLSLNETDLDFYRELYTYFNRRNLNRRYLY